MSIKPNKKLLVMAGGTGGHVFPALAVAKQLQQHGWEIRWLGTADRMEATLVPQHGIEIDFIKVKGLRGQGIVNLLKAPFQIISAIFQARRHIKAWQPDVVLGMGGYVSGPGGMAAWLSGIPLVLHEQNAVAGLTNRWLSKIATTVMQAFPKAFPNAEVVGNPVRQDLTQIAAPNQRFAARDSEHNAEDRSEERSEDGDKRDIRILVMGGSQGAQILNRTLPVVMEQLGDGFTIRHQSGKGQKEEVDALYQQHHVKQCDVTEFIDDVAQAYAWADVVVCRSGALTVSEIAAVGVGAVFIPFMHKDRQQALNADHLVEAGAAVMIEQPDLTPEKLTQTLQTMTRESLLAMANEARNQSIIDADIRVAKALSDAIKIH